MFPWKKYPWHLPSGKLPFECQKIVKNLTSFFKKIVKNCHIFQKIANGNFLEKKTILSIKKKKSRFWQFFHIQMAFFRRIRCFCSDRKLAIKQHKRKGLLWSILLQYLPHQCLKLYYFLAQSRQKLTPSGWGYLSLTPIIYIPTKGSDIFVCDWSIISLKPTPYSIILSPYSGIESKSRA